jgi:opacity protein-like surface antigen
MNMKLIAIAALSITTLTLASSAQAQPAPERYRQYTSAQSRPIQIGPSVSFGGNSTVFGIDSRFPISQEFSLRPSVRFPTGGVAFGAAATYDFNLARNGDRQLEPYVGAGFNVNTGDNTNNGANISGYAIGGVDYSLTDQFALKGSVAFPFKPEYATNFTVSLGYQY